jgi:hypothetical protein
MNDQTTCQNWSSLVGIRDMTASEMTVRSRFRRIAYFVEDTRPLQRIATSSEEPSPMPRSGDFVADPDPGESRLLLNRGSDVAVLTINLGSGRGFKMRTTRSVHSSTSGFKHNSSVLIEMHWEISTRGLVIPFPEALRIVREPIIHSPMLHSAGDAFRCAADATSIVIPSSVTHLDSSSFAGSPHLAVVAFAAWSRLRGIAPSTFGVSTSLKSICFPACLESLPYRLFTAADRDGCCPSVSLQTVTFESGSRLREICDFAFEGCDSLKSICVPASVARLSGASFARCGLRQISIESGSRFYRVSGDFVMDLKGVRIVRYFGCNLVITIPDCVEVLGRDSFLGCGSIRRVAFAPNSNLNRIERSAFGHCPHLTSIAIPSIATFLEMAGFEGCQSLRTVSFCANSRLANIEQWAFRSCSSLESIAVPWPVEILGVCCFSECKKLVTMTFAPDSQLTRIAPSAFEKCLLLGPLRLPSALKYVAARCFSECNSMSTLTFCAPCHIRELLDLPPRLTGLFDIPDSVEILRFGLFGSVARSYALHFGTESKLTRIQRDHKRSFLHYSSRTLKTFRSEFELPPENGIWGRKRVF